VQYRGRTDLLLHRHRTRNLGVRERRDAEREHQWNKLDGFAGPFGQQTDE
jgi:hypothetical protein